jgi:3-hydroxybutyryl-CoA dehydrogenase
MTLRMGIAGAGMVGSQVAIRALRHGVEVCIVARDPQATRARFAAAQATTGDAFDPHALRIDSSHSIFADVDLVYESLPERLELKQALFRDLEDVVGADIPLVSGTSSLSPAQLGAEMRTPQRVFVAHFIHPVTTVNLAEVLAPEAPDAAARATFEAWLRDMDLDAIVLERAVPGFIVNRLQFALLREAVSLVASGIATAADVDRIITHGLGPRWTATGPLASMDLAGTPLFRDVAAIIAPTLENGTMTEHLDPYIADGRFGAAAGGGLRTWESGDIARAIDARRKAYAFASDLHARGDIPAGE